MERANNFPQVPLLADGGDWVPIESFVHFLRSHHTCLWALCLHYVTRTKPGAVLTLLKLKNILSLTAKQQWPLNAGFIHLFCSVYKTLTVEVFDNYQCGGMVLLASLKSMQLDSSSTFMHPYSSHYVCFFETMTGKSPDGHPKNLTCSAPRIPSLALQTRLAFPECDVSGRKSICLVGSTSWQQWGWVFKPSPNISSLIGELELHVSLMYCNISEIIPGPTFGQQKHKSIDSCKRDFKITFPVCPL